MRLSISEYFMKMAFVVAERSTCRRHHVGAVATRNKHVLATGYNGAIAGLKDCLELGCLRDQTDLESGFRVEVCRAVHAEQNVLVQASLHGVSLEGATVYCTHAPCLWCAKALANARIKAFVWCFDYEGFDIAPFKDVRVEHYVLAEPNLSISVRS